jgi:hypothetical protein
MRAMARGIASGSAALVLLVLLGCGGSSGSGPDGGDESGTLSGTIRTTGQIGLEGATISVGSHHATSDANGQYELADLPTGSASVEVQRPGYLPATTNLSISLGTNTHDFALTAQEIYVSSTNAWYVPAGVGPLRGAIITLGGPLTNGFVTGEPIGPPGNPALEASLQALGTNLRSLAKTMHVALFGTSTFLTNAAASDIQILNGLSVVAQSSGHPELTNAPVLTFGLSAGGPESAGFVSRNPGRAIGLLARVPVDVTSLTDPVALAVPSLVMQGELDANVNNLAVQAKFTENRSHGGLWALAIEPGADHQTGTNIANSMIVSWINAVLSSRLPATSGATLITLDEESGWLGNQTTLEIAAWADYSDDPTTASWLPNSVAAQAWKGLVTPPVGGGSARR